VNFLFDAQLPRRLAFCLCEQGHDAIHTLDLPRANKTPDQEINELSVRESRVVVTKDSDFVDSLILRGQPWKLLPLGADRHRGGAKGWIPGTGAGGDEEGGGAIRAGRGVPAVIPA